jgi:hypothetical protein
MPTKHSSRKPIIALIIFILVLVGAITAWHFVINRATHAAPAQTVQTTAGLSKIKEMYAGYTAVSNDYSRQPLAQRDAYLQPYLSADLLKKVDSITNFDAIVCSYGSLPKTISYDTPFVSAGDGVVVNVTFHASDGSPGNSTGVTYDPESQKIVRIFCADQNH